MVSPPSGYINTSKSYNFNPDAGELVLEAYSRCMVRPTEITATHLKRGETAANLILAEFSNMQPNLWEVELGTIPLGAGVKEYSLPAEVVNITDLYIRTGSGQTARDRIATSMSRTEYASLPDKDRQGPPNQYWFFRGISPTIWFYYVPDSNGPYLANYYYTRQTQDVQLAGGDTVEIPYRFLPAFVAGVAWLLSKHYRPEMTQGMFADYQYCLKVAQTQDVENTPLYVTPSLGGYWR